MDKGMGEPQVPQRKDAEVLEQIANELELLKEYVLEGNGEPITRSVCLCFAWFGNSIAARVDPP